MGNKTNVYSVIVPAEDANLLAHTYSEIYGGKIGCKIVLNDISVDVGPSSSINVLINTVSGGVGCYLLGDNSNVYQGSIIL